jgi:hypothetical protein
MTHGRNIVIKLFVIDLRENPENFDRCNYLPSPWTHHRGNDNILRGYYAIGANKKYQLFVPVGDDYEATIFNEPLGDFLECPKLSIDSRFSKLTEYFDYELKKQIIRIDSANERTDQRLVFVSVITDPPQGLRLVVSEQVHCKSISDYAGASPKCVYGHYLFKMIGSEAYFTISYGDKKNRITWSGIK